mgnify:CR=1 FL=1
MKLSSTLLYTYDAASEVNQLMRDAGLYKKVPSMPKLGSAISTSMRSTQSSIGNIFNREKKDPEGFKKISQILHKNLYQNFDSTTVNSLHLTASHFYKPAFTTRHLMLAPSIDGVKKLLESSTGSFHHEHYANNKHLKLPMEVSDSDIQGLQEKGFLENVRVLDLSKCQNLTGASLHAIGQCGRIKELKLPKNFNSSAIHFKSLENLKNLETLHSDAHNFNQSESDEIANSLSKIASLKHLTFANTSVSDIGIRKICRNLDLHSFDLSGSKVISDTGTASLHLLQNLKDLNLKGINHPLPPSFFSISALPKLEKLSIGLNFNTAQSLEDARNLVSLQHLELEHEEMTISANAIGHILEPLQQLKSLTIGNCGTLPNMPTSDIEKLKQLESITFKGIPDEKTIQGLSQLPRLHSLTIAPAQLAPDSKNYINSETINAIGNLKELTSLHLRGNINIGTPKPSEICQWEHRETAKVEELSNAINKLKKLKNISLDVSIKRHLFPSSPIGITNKKSIEAMQLNYHDSVSLSSVLRDAAKQKNVKQLSFELPYSCHLNHVQKHTLSGMKSLERIDFTQRYMTPEKIATAKETAQQINNKASIYLNGQLIKK